MAIRHAGRQPLTMTPAAPPTTHLLDAQSPEASPATLAWIAAQLRQQPADTLITLGPKRLAHHAERCGVYNPSPVSATGISPHAHALLQHAAVRALRRAGSPTHVQAWSSHAARLARQAWPGAQLRVTLSRYPQRDEMRWLAQSRPDALCLADAGLASRELQALAGELKITAPLIELEHVPRGDREALRAELQLRPDTRLIVAGDPPQWVNTSYAMTTAAVTGLAMYPDDLHAVRILVPPHAKHIGAYQKMLQRMQQPGRVIPHRLALTPWLALAAADACLLLSPKPAERLWPAWAAALNVPVITADETLPQAEPDYTTQQPGTRALATCVTRALQIVH